MAQIQKGHTFSTGESVTAAKLNSHVDDAALLEGAISEQTALTTTPANDDEVLVRDTSAGRLVRATWANLKSWIQSAIPFTGLAALTQGKILAGNSSNEVAATTVGGDLTAVENSGTLELTLNDDTVDVDALADEAVTTRKLKLYGTDRTQGTFSGEYAVVAGAMADNIASISGIVDSTTYSTVTTSAAHGFSNGDNVIIAGVTVSLTDPGYNATHATISNVTSTTFRIAAANGASGTITVTDAICYKDTDQFSLQAGDRIQFKASAASLTGGTTIKLDGLPAATIKTNVSDDLIAGSIIQDQVVELIYDGTNFQLPAIPRTFTSATQSWDSAALNTFAHGLGVVPSHVRVVAVCTNASNAQGFSVDDEVDVTMMHSNQYEELLVFYADDTNVYVRTNNVAAMRIMSTAGADVVLEQTGTVADYFELKVYASHMP